MEKVKRWLSEKVFWLKTGVKITTANDGKPVDQHVIKFKGYYLEIMTDVETGEPCDWGWSEDPTMFHVPVREFYEAKR